MTSIFQLKAIDHMVLTSRNPEPMIAFYTALGFNVVKDGDRYAMKAPNFKINMHVVGKELEPKAQFPTPGSADICLEVTVASTVEEMAAYLKECGLNVIVEPVARRGSRGKMTSCYLRDPDGNLVELSVYPRE